MLALIQAKVSVWVQVASIWQVARWQREVSGVGVRLPEHINHGQGLVRV